MLNKELTAKTIVFYLLFVNVLLLIGIDKSYGLSLIGQNLGLKIWEPKPGWSWGLPAGFLGVELGWGRYEIWNVTAQNNDQPYIWYSGQKGAGDQGFYTITRHDFTTPAIKSDHLYGPWVNTCHGCDEKKTLKHSMDFTTSWTQSQGIDLTSSISFDFGGEFEARGVGARLGVTVSKGVTFSKEWTYGKSITHHFDLEVPPPGGRGETHGYRTRDFFVDYRGALWAWSGKLRGVVYDDSIYSTLDNYVIPPGDPDVFIFHFERTVKCDVYTEQHKPCVPEPSTLLLLGSGLVGLVGFGRKRLLKKV